MTPSGAGSTGWTLRLTASGAMGTFTVPGDGFGAVIKIDIASIFRELAF